MNVYITRLNGFINNDYLQFTQQTTADIAHQLGIREMAIYCFDQTSEKKEARSVRFDGMIAGLTSGDVVILQLPTCNLFSYEIDLIKKIKAYGSSVILLLHAIPGLDTNTQSNDFYQSLSLFNQADALIVSSNKIKEYLLKNGVQETIPFIIQELPDYPAANLIHTPAPFSQRIYSNTDLFITKNLRMNPIQLMNELSDGGFGLVWYDNPSSLNFPSLDISTFLAAGIPVIIPRNSLYQQLIIENHLGIIVDTIEEANEKIKHITEEEYQHYSSSVQNFAALLKNGYFSKQSLSEAIFLLMRKDALHCKMPDKIYDSKLCKFNYATINQSYGDRLAVTWDYRGNACGFLVCDVKTQDILYETNNIKEHICLLEHTALDTTLIIKAYEQTINGRLIIAVSEPISLSVSAEQNITPEVSLIIPAYNAEKFVARCIDTALAQTFKNLEIIVVNDGSIDKTLQIVKWYSDTYPNVILINQPNGGLSVARNTGIRNAHGKYIEFSDSDDMLRPTMIETLHSSIVKNNCDIASVSVCNIQLDLNGHRKYAVYMHYPIKENTCLSRHEFLDTYMQNDYPIVMNKLYKATLIKNFEFPVTMHEDEAWTPVVLSHANNVCHINEALYEYDQTQNLTSAIVRANSSSVEKRFLARKEYTSYFLKYGNPEERDWLIRFALKKVNEFIAAFDYPKYYELKTEIEHFYDKQ